MNISKIFYTVLLSTVVISTTILAAGSNENRLRRRLTTIQKERDEARRFGAQLRIQCDDAKEQLRASRKELEKAATSRIDLTSKIDQLSGQVDALTDVISKQPTQEVVQEKPPYEDLITRARDLNRELRNVKVIDEKRDCCPDVCPKFSACIALPAIFVGALIAGPAGVKAATLGVGGMTALETVAKMNEQADEIYNKKHSVIDPLVELFLKSQEAHKNIVVCPEFKRIFSSKNESLQCQYHAILCGIIEGKNEGHKYLTPFSQSLGTLLTKQKKDWEKYACTNTK